MQQILSNDLLGPGTTVPLLLIGIVMFGAWTAAYLTIIRTAYRDRSYGIPMINSCLNISWEFMFSFNLVAVLPPFFCWGNRLWLIFDAINLVQLFRFGRDVQSVPWLRKYFYPIATGTLVISAVGLYNFLIYFNDVYGVASALLMDLLMSMLFISLLFRRPDLRGLSYSGAWLRMIGDVASFIFLAIWWPAQFADGRLIGVPHVPEPPSFTLLYVLYTLITGFDCTYIYLFWKRRKQLQEGMVSNTDLTRKPLAAVGA